MTTRRILDPHLVRTLRAEARGKRIGRIIDRLIRDAWRQVLAALPDDPRHPHRFFIPDVIKRIIRRLLAKLPHVYAAEMAKLAVWGHATAARSISAAARRSMRREDRNDDFSGGSDSFGSGIDDRFLPDNFGFTKPARTLGDFAGFDYSTTLVAAPTVADLARIVGPVPQALTRLNADQAAQTVMQGIARGADRREIAKALQSQFNRSATTARSIARTEGGRIATATTVAVSEQLGTMVIGYQVHAVPETEFSRPDHLRRSGTIYFRHPKGNQKGFDQMPHPPIDPGGKVCFNCRCWVSPFFGD